MRHTLRLPLAAAALTVLAACSPSAPQPTITDDLRQDLARAGAGEVQLAGAPSTRLDVVSAVERGESDVPAPRARAVAKAPSVRRGTRAAVTSVRHDVPAAAPAPAREDAVVPVEEPREIAPAPVPSSMGRPDAPRPSTQREPAGGWKTPGQVIRNAPFPINP